MEKDCLIGVRRSWRRLFTWERAAKVTFNKDVPADRAAALSDVSWPSEVAPFSLLTFTMRGRGQGDQDRRPHAADAAVAVEPQYDHKFSNAARLSQAERDSLAAWADGGGWKAIRKQTGAGHFTDGWNSSPT